MMKYAYFVVIVTAIRFTNGQRLAVETCEAPKPFVEIFPEADAVIGVTINVHKPGEGVYGCGGTNEEGFIMYEAMRWCVSILNQETGLVSGISVTDSFIPGVKIGLRIYDNCGHQDVAIHQLVDMFPIIKSGSSSCSFATNSSVLMLGVIDQTTVTYKPQVEESFLQHHLTKIGLHSNYLSPNYLAKVLTSVADFLQWEKVAILYQDDKYSNTVVELLSGSLCIVSKTLLSEDVLSNYKKNIAYLATILKRNTGILVVAQGEPLNQLLIAMEETKDTASRMQWLFSWVIPPQLLQPIEVIGNVYSLAPHPMESNQLESYWHRLTDPAAYSFDNDSSWFQEYLLHRTRCESCQNVAMRDTDLEILYRTSRMLSAFNAVYSMAHSLRSVWRDKCEGLRGLCDTIHRMGRQEFLENYLQTDKFYYTTVDRSPSGLVGHKSSEDVLGKTEGGKVSICTYYMENGIPNCNPVAVYEGDSVNIVDPDFRSIPSPCSKLGCRDCIRSRQGRTNDQPSVKNDDISILGSPKDLFLVILLPLHHSGTNPLECGPELQMESVEDLEAAIWAIDLINANQSYLPGMKLGIVVVDTCSSPLRLTHQLISYLSDKADINGEVKLESVIGVVSVVNPDEISAASLVLSPLNITSISVNDRGTRRNLYDLQVPIDSVSLASALADVLRHLGWSYIVSIYDHENLQSYSIFREECYQRGICFALEHQLGETSLNNKLDSARKRGARVVVLWTNSPSIGTVFETASNSTDFIWIVVRTWIHHSLDDIFNKYESILSGKIFIFSAKEGNDERFSSYFEHLQPEKTRNPWFSNYWHAKNCSDGGCRIARHSASNVIRAINSLASGLSHLHSEACRIERGLCPTLRQHGQIRQLLNLYVRRQSLKVDDDQEFFKYTSNGSGDMPIGIYKVRRMNDIWPYFQKVGDYHNGLKSLAGMSAESGEEITSECISQCFLCPWKKSDYLITEKHADFYIAASLTVHGPSENPLECGAILGIQEVEAFLWAIDQVNDDTELLPGMKVGAIIIDTCGSREKTSRDIGNLFSHYTNQAEPHVPDKLVGFIAAQSQDLVAPISDVTVPLSITTIAPTMTENSNGEESLFLIQTGVDNSIVIQCLLEVLKLYRWNYISIVYSNDDLKQATLYDSLNASLKDSNVRVALIEKLSKRNKSTWDTSIDNTLRRLIAKTEKGSRICVLLLSYSHMDVFLKRAKYWIKRKIYHPGDIQWLTVGNLDILKNNPLVSAGTLAITPTVYPVPKFTNYFSKLSIVNNSRNPWFKEHWEASHKCRGVACFSGLENSEKRDTEQSPLVSSIIQGIFVLAQGLHSLKMLVCPTQDRTHCKMSDIEERQLLYNFCINSVEEENNKRKEGVQLVIMNIRKVQSNAVDYAQVGTFSAKNGIAMNASKAKTYNGSGSEIDLMQISSVYVRAKHDSRVSARWKKSDYLETVPQKPWVIQFMIPIHVPHRNFFTCGEIDKAAFQTVAGIVNSLYEVNRGIVESKTLGGIIFDTCDQQQRAQEQIFNFFDPEDNVYSTPLKSVIAVVAFGEEVFEGISTVLESINIAQVLIPSFFVTNPKSSSRKDLTHNQSHALALSAVVQHFGWNSIYMLTSSTDKAQQVYYEFKESVGDLCIAKSIILHPGDNADHIAVLLKDTLEDSLVEVVVLILDNVHLARNVIWAARETGLMNKVAWLETEGWADHHLIQELLFESARFLAVRISNPIIPGFEESYTRYTLSKRGGIPNDWFDEMWQSTFHCRLNDSSNSLNAFSVPCSGKETIAASDFIQSRRVSEGSRAIDGIATGLREFFSKHCNISHEVKDLDECGSNAHILLSEEIKKSVTNVIDYDIVELQKHEHGNFIYKKVGNWSAGELRLPSFTNRYSSCTKECLPCGKVIGNSSQTAFFELLPLFNSIRTLPNIIFTALSSLGIVLVTICALYFLAVFPVAVGTTVLGYTILVGLLLLYASNFVFIMEPNPITCGLRRFVMGFAYSIVYAGMLVKLMNTWRMMDYHGNGMTEDYSRASGSNGLLILALGLVTIQVILMASWLVLMPPRVVTHNAKWKCVPVDTFELELLVSHTYVFLLLFVAILFGIVTRKSNDNQKEARWILGACLISAAIWIAWPLTIVHIPLKYRNHVLLSANLLSASCVMVCLYLRKAYIYGKLNKKAIDQEIKARLHPNGQRTTYGTPVNQRETVTRGIQVRRGRRFEEENGIGTLQVQVADLYPLDMYEGGTQFLPPGRWSTHRRR